MSEGKLLVDGDLVICHGYDFDMIVIGGDGLADLISDTYEQKPTKGLNDHYGKFRITIERLESE